MLADLLRLLIETVGNILTMLLLLRFFMQWTRTPFGNPLGHFTTGNFVSASIASSRLYFANRSLCVIEPTLI